MDRPRLVPQLYGYAVCLVCVITILISSNHLINGLFDTVSPEMSREVTFAIDSYRQRATMAPPGPGGEATVVAELVPDSVWRARFEEDRTQRIAMVRYNGLRSVVSATLVLLIATAFFIGHWRWLRRIGQTEMP